MRVGSSFRKGTWTPALTFSTPGDLNTVYSLQVGEYVLADGVVRASFAITATTFTHATASGSSRIAGLPFTARTLSGMVWSGSLSVFRGISKASYAQFGVQVASATNFVALTANANGLPNATVDVADLSSGALKTMYGVIAYPVA